MADVALLDSGRGKRHWSSALINEMFREFFRDKLRIAVMFLLYTLLCLGMWLYLDDEGALVAGILCGGVSAHQFYKFYLQKRSSERNSE